MFIVTPYHNLCDTHTHTLGSTSLDLVSARCRDLQLTTNNTLKRQTSMSPEGIEPAIPASEWPETHTLDSAASKKGRISVKTVK